MKGFNNIGNTCYLNSGLQMLIRNKDLCKIIYQYSNTDEDINNVCDFIKEYYDESHAGPITPKFIKNLVSKKNDMFSGFQQHDSMEFINFLLDTINEKINKSSSKKDLIYKLFQYNLEVKIKCKLLACLNVSKHTELPSIMMLDINSNTSTLDDLYKNMLKKEKLEGDSKYYCEKCKANRIASKRMNILNFPKHLIIWVKRFKANMRKNTQHIEFPLQWINNYTLQGVVFHSGDTYGGHYVYVGKEHNKWYLFDDSCVSELNNDALQIFLNSGYIYYYKTH